MNEQMRGFQISKPPQPPQPSATQVLMQQQANNAQQPPSMRSGMWFKSQPAHPETIMAPPQPRPPLPQQRGVQQGGAFNNALSFGSIVMETSPMHNNFISPKPPQ